MTYSSFQYLQISTNTIPYINLDNSVSRVPHILYRVNVLSQPKRNRSGETLSIRTHHQDVKNMAFENIKKRRKLKLKIKQPVCS